MFILSVEGLGCSPGTHSFEILVSAELDSASVSRESLRTSEPLILLSALLLRCLVLVVASLIEMEEDFSVQNESRLQMTCGCLHGWRQTI
jgi:hypothetical protein